MQKRKKQLRGQLVNMQIKSNKYSFVKIILVTLKTNWCLEQSTNKIKRQSTEWEKIYANNLSDKNFFKLIYF